MNNTFFITIEANKESKVTVQAHSKTTASVFITAADLEAAQALMTSGNKMAEDAMAAWTPEQADASRPDPEQQHYYVYTGRSVEEMDRAVAAYEKSAKGQRFVKCLENARTFYWKHSKRGLLVTQMGYLANLHHNSMLDGSIDLAALAYRRGYRDGQKAARNK